MEQQHPPVLSQILQSETYESNIKVTARALASHTMCEILEFDRLRGLGADVDTLHSLTKLEMKLKQIKVTLTNGEMRCESGALQYMKGNLAMDASIGGLGNILKSKLTKESVVKPKYKGSGEVWLEPTWGYYSLFELNNETAIVDSGYYFASDGDVEIGAEMQKHVSSALFGGEGLFQTKVSGKGWVVLTTPVPPTEIQKLHLNNEKLSVDGNFAILRKGNIDFKVEKSSRGLFSSAISGEGLLQTFTGTGEVWLCPTVDYYPAAAPGNPNAKPSLHYGNKL